MRSIELLDSDDKDTYFTEEENEDKRVLSYDSGVNSSINDDDDDDKSTLEEMMDLLPPKRVPADRKKVQRIKRGLLKRIIIDIQAIISMTLSLPILIVLVLLAIYKTTKTHVLDVLYHKTERSQDILENALPDEDITQDETYYAEKWGYISEKHEVVTEDGYIIIIYRLYRKGCKPSGMISV